MPELINTKRSDPYEEYFKKIGKSEFFHSFEAGGAAVGLRILSMRLKILILQLKRQMKQVSMLE